MGAPHDVRATENEWNENKGRYAGRCHGGLRRAGGSAPLHGGQPVGHPRAPAVERCHETVTCRRSGRVAIAALLCAVVLSGCSLGDEGPTESTVIPRDSGDPSAVEITVTGRVAQVLDTYVFEIGTPSGEPVLVVAPPGVPAAPGGTDVEVTGSVVTFDVAAIERRLGAGLNPELQRFNGRPSVVAKRIMAAARGG